MYSRRVGPSRSQRGSWPGTWRVGRRLECVAKHLRDYGDFDRAADRNAAALDALCPARSARAGNFDGGFADLWSDLSLRGCVARSRLAFTAWRRGRNVSSDGLPLNIDRAVWCGCGTVWATIEYKSVLLKYGSAALRVSPNSALNLLQRRDRKDTQRAAEAQKLL